MAYTKTTWVARDGSNLQKFLKSSETSTSVILINDPIITEEGTPFSTANMNNIENGIDDLYNNSITIGGKKHFQIQQILQAKQQGRLLLAEG